MTIKSFSVSVLALMSLIGLTFGGSAQAFTPTYSMELVSSPEVSTSLYNLVVDVHTIDSSEMDVYYTLNSLDTASKKKMTRHPFLSYRYNSPSALILREGSNRITTFITDKNGEVVSGEGTIKVFNVTRTSEQPPAEQEEAQFAYVNIQAPEEPVTLDVDGRVSLKLIATYSDGTTKDVTNSSTWSSSDDRVAVEIARLNGPRGTFYGRSAGTATVTATFDPYDQSGYDTITINVMGPDDQTDGQTVEEQPSNDTNTPDAIDTTGTTEDEIQDAEREQLEQELEAIDETLSEEGVTEGELNAELERERERINERLAELKNADTQEESDPTDTSRQFGNSWVWFLVGLVSAGALAAIIAMILKNRKPEDEEPTDTMME